MLTEKFYKEHITFTSVADIQNLIKPLQDIGITYFTYDKNYDDGTHIRLTTHGQWIESYYRQELYNAAIFEKDLNLFSTGYVFWSWLNREPVYSAAAQHDIDHGITLIQKQTNSCDFYHFGASCKSFLSPDNLVRHLGLLYRFVDFFRDRAADLIKIGENNRICLRSNQYESIDLPAFNRFANKISFPDFLKKTEVRKLYLGEEFDNAYLTRREIDIVRLLMQGKKSVDISGELSLSDRTLEVHVSHIKNKFKCNTLFELGFLLGSLGPKSLYPFKIRKPKNREIYNGALA